jgi:hypothetical protein
MGHVRGTDIFGDLGRCRNFKNEHTRAWSVTETDLQDFSFKTRRKENNFESYLVRGVKKDNIKMALNCKGLR